MGRVQRRDTITQRISRRTFLHVSQRAAMLGGLAAVAPPLLAGCGSSTSSGKQLKEITMLFARQAPDSDYAPLFAPVTLGYFAQEGLKVNFQYTSGSPEVVKLLNAGQGDVGMPGADATMIARVAGADIQDYFTSDQKLIYAFGGVAGKGVHTPADLKGKKVGVLSLQASPTYLMKAIASRAGLDPNRDVSFLPLGVGAQAVAAVKQGRVDAVAYHDTQLLQFREEGINIDFFPTPAFDSFFTTMVTARTSMFKDSPETLVGFARALAKGTIYCLENPEAGLRAAAKAVPALNTDTETKLALLKERNLKKILPSEANDTVGWNSNARYSQFAAFLVQQGVVKESPRLAESWNGTLLDEINKFDKEKIKASARG